MSPVNQTAQVITHNNSKVVRTLTSPNQGGIINVDNGLSTKL